MSLKTEDVTEFVKKHPISFACGLISVALLVSAYLRSDLLSTQQDELEQKTATALRLTKNLTNSEKLTEQLQALVGTNDAVKKRSIRPADLATNIQYFYRLETESGVKYSDLRPVGQSAASASGKTYIAVNYSLSVRGGYVQLLAFLRMLERGSNFSRITSFVMNNGGTGAAAGEITLNLTVDLLGQP